VKQEWLKSAIFCSNYWIFHMIDDDAPGLLRRLQILDDDRKWHYVCIPGRRWGL